MSERARALPVEDVRQEILRLIASLRAERRLGGTPSARLHRRLGALLGPDGGSARARVRAPARPPARDRRGELDAIKRLRAQAEAKVAQRSSARGDVEDRLARMERQLLAGASAAAPSAAAASPKASESSDAMFRGAIAGDMLSDMLQLVASNALTGVFTVDNDGERIELFCDEGRICHAVGQGLTGETAFFAAFAYPQGQYSFKKLEQLPEERTITNGTQFLILEALRQIDEQNGGGAAE